MGLLVAPCGGEAPKKPNGRETLWSVLVTHSSIPGMELFGFSRAGP